MRRTLAISIGNSTTRLGVYAGGRIVEACAFATHGPVPLAKLRRLLKGRPCDTACVCSVVPARTAPVCAAVGPFVKGPLLRVGTQVRVPMRSRYGAGLGQDRLVGAWQALRRYGAPVIVVDCGTAVTVNAVSRKGIFSGGMIFPGAALCTRALGQGTALLPGVAPSAPRGVLGIDAGSCIRNGVAFGCGGAVEAMVGRIKRTSGFSGARVVATGGGARFLKRWCRAITTVDEQLLLKGLGALAQEGDHGKKA